jgi:hypothetical protein
VDPQILNFLKPPMDFPIVHPAEEYWFRMFCLETISCVEEAASFHGWQDKGIERWKDFCENHKESPWEGASDRHKDYFPLGKSFQL